jgi:hypothetical protein
MRRWTPPILLFLLCVGFYWRLTLSGQYSFLDSPDLANYDFPRLHFQAAEWRHLRLPLWDPYQWMGQPLLGQVTGAAYPANWLLALAPFREGKLSVTTVHWYLVLLHVQAALFAYWLCRDWKRSRGASMLGGLTFSLSGFMAGTEWPQILNAAVWLPLVVLFLFRAMRGRAAVFSATVSGALVGVMWWSGHHEVPIYVTTAVAGVWAIGLWRGVRWQLAALAAAATLLVGAWQILPAQEYAPLAKRWAGGPDPLQWNEPIPYAVHEHYGWKLDAALGLVTPRPRVHIDPFVGVVVFSLAALGVLAGWRRSPQVRWLVGLGVAGVVLALANGNFVHGVLYAVAPVFGKARVPARALVLLGFALGPLAAYGVDALRRRAGWGPALVASAMVGGGVLAGASATGFWALAGAALVVASWRRAMAPELAAGALVVMAMMEWGSVFGVGMANRAMRQGVPGHLDRLYHHGDIASFLRAQNVPVRVGISDKEIPYNFGDWHGIPTQQGFGASVTSTLFDMEVWRPAIQDLFGINFYVGAEAPRPGLVKVADSRSGLQVFANPGALPRAWAVHRVSTLGSAAELRQRLNDPGYSARTEAVMLGAAPALEACDGEETVALRLPYRASRVEIDAKLGCRGLVVLSDTYFPGWRVTVDGQPAAILEVYGALRGVVVEGGVHRVEMVYRPGTAYWGGGAAMVGFLLVGWAWRRRTKVFA